MTWLILLAHGHQSILRSILPVDKDSDFRDPSDYPETNDQHNPIHHMPPPLSPCLRSVPGAPRDEVFCTSVSSTLAPQHVMVSACASACVASTDCSTPNLRF